LPTQGFDEPTSNVVADEAQQDIHKSLATIDAARSDMLKFMFPDTEMPYESVAHVMRPDQPITQCPGKRVAENTPQQNIALRAWSTAAQSADPKCFVPVASTNESVPVHALISHRHKFIFFGGVIETSPALEAWLVRLIRSPSACEAGLTPTRPNANLPQVCRFGAEWEEQATVDNFLHRYAKYLHVHAETSIDPAQRALTAYMEAVQQVFDPRPSTP